MPNPFEREIEVFNAALELPAAERAAFLDQACAGDNALRQRVEEHLRASEAVGAFLENPAATPPESGKTIRLTVNPAEKTGDRIGRYKLLQQIGEGGCGIVYMAEQEEPVRRMVALKVIKLGMDTRQVIARFEAERQALALMDHPNIAKVLEAGATDAGRPYFVMELVRGIKITDYCDQNNLPTRERLKLFVEVCQAVQHAHQKGIIHRDIKPSNILVTLRDGVAVPKVIDFGIAKATTDQRLTDKTLFTAFQQFIGTPAYMSPEQAEMSELGIDTRSDIYSLGVLLYELLTSHTPFDEKELLQAGLDAMRRIIREKEPTRPSTRLSTLLEVERTNIANNRQTDVPKLVHLLRGDLDWIVIKSLEKDRTRRYETANGLAMDVQRHLDDEPVVARPPSNFYKFQKSVQRNMLAFIAVATVIGALVIGLGVSTWQYTEKSRAEREQSRQRLKAEAETQKAQTEAAKSQQVAQFLKDMLQGVGPSKALGRDTVMLREILDKTAKRISKDLTNQPEVEIEIFLTLASTYEELALYTQMEDMTRQALQLVRTSLGEQNPVFATTLGTLGTALWREGDYVNAEIMLRDALARYKKLAGDEHPDAALLRSELGGVLWKQDKLPEAETLSREALAIQRKVSGNENSDVARYLNNLAMILQEEGKLAEAEPLQREALAMRRKFLGNEHPDLAVTLQNMSLLLDAQGKKAEAEAMGREALAMQRKLLGNEHPLVANLLDDLAGYDSDRGELAESESMYREALAIRRKVFGNEHPEVVDSLINLTAILYQEGKLAEAETNGQEAVAVLRKLPGGVQPQMAVSLNILAWAQLRGGEANQAEPSAREALAIRRKLLGNDDLAVAESLDTLAWVISAEGKNIEGESVAREGLAIRRKSLGNEHVLVGESLHVVASMLQRQGKLAEAEPVHRESLAMRRKLEGNESADVLESLNSMGSMFADEGKFTEAEAVYRELLATNRKLNGNDHASTIDSLNSLVRALAAQHRDAEVEQLFGDFLTPALIGKPQSAGVLRARGEFRARHGRWKDAAADFSQVIALDPTDHWDYFRLAPLLVWSKDFEGYRRYCGMALARFGVTKDPVIAEQMSKDCLILPDSNVDMIAVGVWADLAITMGKDSAGLPWSQFSKGLAEYRQGHFANAVEWTQKTLTTSLPNRDVEAYAVLAMAQQKLNHVDESSAALAKGIEIDRTKLAKLDSGDLGDDWFDWFIAKTLLHEATTLIQGAPPAK